MFEFSRFCPADYQHGRDFIADLDNFLGHLPKGWPYGVEMRNRNWLKPEYFECLARHQVAHVFNSWEAMPPVESRIGAIQAQVGEIHRPARCQQGGKMRRRAVIDIVAERISRQELQAVAETPLELRG